VDKQDIINEARIFHLAASTVLPLLERMHAEAYEKLIGKFRNGNTDLVNHVARVEALYTIQEEIKNKARNYETYVSKGE